MKANKDDIKYIEILKAIQFNNETYSHIELYDVRKMFIEQVIDKYGQYPEFDSIVEKQLDCWYAIRINHPQKIKVIDSREFYRTCNNPFHLIRNRLIAWHIDHPKHLNGGN